MWIHNIMSFNLFYVNLRLKIHEMDMNFLFLLNWEHNNRTNQQLFSSNKNKVEIMKNEKDKNKTTSGGDGRILVATHEGIGDVMSGWDVEEARARHGDYVWLCMVWWKWGILRESEGDWMKGCWKWCQGLRLHEEEPGQFPSLVGAWLRHCAYGDVFRQKKEWVVTVSEKEIFFFVFVRTRV